MELQFFDDEWLGPIWTAASHAWEGFEPPISFLFQWIHSDWIGDDGL